MRFTRMTQKILVLVCAGLVASSVSGCDLFDSGGTTTRTSPGTGTGTGGGTGGVQPTGFTYDRYLCQKMGAMYTGRCYLRSSGSVYNVYNYSDFIANRYSYARLSPVFQQDFSNPAYVTYKFVNGDGLWHRINIATSANEVFTNGQWLAQNLHESQLAQEGEKRYWDLMEDINESKHRSAMEWLAPACTSSYNGC